MIHIIGGGIAGLYAAYKLKQRGIKVRVYEKSDRLGGRIGTFHFAGRDVPSGAGIGRGKDVMLRKLCEELGMKVEEFKTEFKYRLPSHYDDVDINKTVRLLRENAKKRETFRDLGTRILGASTYRAFVAKTGYSDYEDADAVDTLYNYGFEDTVPGYTALRINWSVLIRRLGEELADNVRLESTIRRVKRGAVTIVATDIDAARKVTGKKLDGVAAQPFVRMYFSCAEDLKCGYTVCSGRFQKIIQMGPGTVWPDHSQMVYMIYCDNNTASRIARSRNVKQYIERGVIEVFGVRITVGEYKLVYWAHGTHYFAPLDSRFGTREQHIEELQRPMRGVYVVGEAVSARQGWCEGALESVERVLDDFTPRSPNHK